MKPVEVSDPFYSGDMLVSSLAFLVLDDESAKCFNKTFRVPSNSFYFTRVIILSDICVEFNKENIS